MDFMDLLNIVPNPACNKGCNKATRAEIAENDICSQVDSAIDNLSVRCVGEHAIQKIHFLTQYFGIFSTGMHKKWSNRINYIEICSGPGRCINRESGDEFNGTALAILEHPAFKYLGQALFFDSDPNVINVLKQRIQARNISNAYVLHGNYNESTDICNKLSRVIPKGSLNLVFIDPTDCSVPFQLIRSMKQVVPNMDLFINIASGTDFNRNIGSALQDQTKFKNSIAKYSRFLDGREFFDDSDNVQRAKRGKFMELRNQFRDTYQKNLVNMGYRFFRFNTVENFYDLLFATSHERGLEFWDKATMVRFDRQRKLF